MSSTRLQKSVLIPPVDKQLHSRLQSDDIAEKLTLVPLGSAHLSGRVDQLHTSHPLIDSEIDFSRKVVNVASKSSHDLSQSWISLGAHGIDDRLRPLLVQPAKRRNLLGAIRLSVCVSVHLCNLVDEMEATDVQRLVAIPLTAAQSPRSQ